MLSLRFALKNLLRNLKYTFGLLFVYFVVSLLCLSFFMFTTMEDDAYTGILNRQASTAYVSVAMDYLLDEPLLDLTEEQESALSQIEGVHEIEKFTFNMGASYFRINENERIEANISVIATRSHTVPSAYRMEFDAIYKRNWLVCGRETQAFSECMVSEAFLSLIGEENSEDILGKTIQVTDFFNAPVACELQIVGVIDVGFSSVSAMENGTKYFLICGMDCLEKSARCYYEYRLFSDYASLTEIEEKVETLGIENVSVSIGNNSYSMRKLAQTAEFISAILALIAILCLLSCITYAIGTSLLKFSRNRQFYYAAFSVGMSKWKLALSFFSEFLIVASIAFGLAIPVCTVMMQGLSHLMILFSGIDFSGNLRLSAMVWALIPIALSAVISMLFVRRKIRFEK